MHPEKLIKQQAESALHHRTTRRGLFRSAGKGAAGLAIGGVAASLGVLVSLTLSLATSTVAAPVEKVYWIDDATFSSFAVDDSIIRSNLDGSGAEVILSEEMDAEFAIPSLAVHSPSGRIYWTNANTNEIKRAGFVEELSGFG